MEQRQINGWRNNISQLLSVFWYSTSRWHWEVILTNGAGGKFFEHEDKVRLVNAGITTDYKIGNQGFTNYKLYTDDKVSKVLLL